MKDKAFEEYDLYTKAVLHHHIIEERVVKPIIEQASKTKETYKVLDVGSGAGFTSKPLLESKLENIEIDALDHDLEMLKLAKEALSKYPNKISYKIGDALIFMDDMKYVIDIEKSQPYDAIITGFFFHNLSIENKVHFLKYSRRILKKKGILSIGDKLANDDPIKHAENYNWLVERINEVALKQDYSS